MTKDFKHCDDYIDDPTSPDCLRAFLSHARAPAHGAHLDSERPKLFATMKDDDIRVRVVMASRFGDVGITENLMKERGYSQRVPLLALTCFSETP